MLLKPVVLVPLAFVFAAILSVLIAWGAAVLIERVTAATVTTRLLSDGIIWAEVKADGLQVKLIGTAPNEAARYRIVNVVSGMVESSRVRDELEVTPVKAVEAPRFSLEMLRNDDGIQMIGLMPAETDEAGLIETAQGLMPEIQLMEMIETASFPAPVGWNEALSYAVDALALLPRSKISVAADRVLITAIANSEAEKRGFEAQLNQTKPEGVRVTIDVSAPRPVLTPFTLRFVKSAGAVQFDACSADTERARAKILAAAGEAGINEKPDCVIGLGVPTPSWGDAASIGIKAVAQLNSGSITFKDADVTLLAGVDVTQAEFDRVVGELESSLPDVFSINSTLEKKETVTAAGPAEFTAVLAKDTGRVELRGRLTDKIQRDVVESFAKAEFGSENVYLAARLDPELPDGWPVRVLAGLQSLGELVHGSLVVRSDVVLVQGVTGSAIGKTRISQILSEKLGQGKAFKVEVTYDKTLDPLAALPTPQECLGDVQQILARQKIGFKPGSTEIDAATDPVMDALSVALRRCPAVKMEIAGHTDSQGSEQGNLSISQARAEAVLVALQGRQVDVSGMIAKGYGEAIPLGDNKTDLGREANRRIEFTLLEPASASVALNPEQAIPEDTIPAAVDPAADAGEAVQAPASDTASDTAPDAAPDTTTGTEPDNATAAAPATDAAPTSEQPAADTSVATAPGTSGTPDFSADTSPSVAPTEKTRRAKARPEQNQ